MSLTILPGFGPAVVSFDHSGMGQSGVPVGLITRRSEVQILLPLFFSLIIHLQYKIISYFWAWSMDLPSSLDLTQLTIEITLTAGQKDLN